MAFDEVQFPPQISYGAQGGPEFNTDVTEMSSGYEQRNANWTYGRLGWNVATGLKTTADVQTLLAFFYGRQGKARGFRFKDWTDFQVTGGTIGTGDGSLATFQLKKQYNDGVVVYVRNILKPVSGTVNIYVDGVLQTLTTAYLIDMTTGLVSFQSGHIPGSTKVVSADFQFDVPVRFDTDKCDVTMENFDTNIWRDIPVIELRLNTSGDG